MKRTNVVVDEKKIREIKKHFEVATTRDAIDLALTELLKAQARKGVLKLKGRIDIPVDLDATRRTG